MLACLPCLCNSSPACYLFAPLAAKIFRCPALLLLAHMHNVAAVLRCVACQMWQCNGGGQAGSVEGGRARELEATI